MPTGVRNRDVWLNNQVARKFKGLFQRKGSSYYYTDVRFYNSCCCCTKLYVYQNWIARINYNLLIIKFLDLAETKGHQISVIYFFVSNESLTQWSLTRNIEMGVLHSEASHGTLKWESYKVQSHTKHWNGSLTQWSLTQNIEIGVLNSEVSNETLKWESYTMKSHTKHWNGSLT